MDHQNSRQVLEQDQTQNQTSLPNAGRSFEDRLPLASFVNMVAEFVTLILAGFVSDWFYHWVILGEIPSDFWLLNSVSTAAIFVLLQTSSGKYSPSWILTQTIGQSHLLRDWLITVSVVLIFSFLSKYTSSQSRGAYILFAILGLTMVFALRKIVFSLFAQAVKSNHFITRNIILIGTRSQVERYYEKQKLWTKGIRVAASLILEPQDKTTPIELWVSHNQLHINLTHIDQITPHLRQVQCDDIVLALPWSNTNSIETILKQIDPLPCTIYLAPDPAMDFVKTGIGAQSNLSEALNDPQTGLSGIRIARRPLTPMARLGKRVFDIIVSGAGIVLLSPLFLLLAALIRLESPGSPIFRQQRNGFNERPFHIFKFRSMVSGNQNPFTQTGKNDTRITKTGAFIRRTNLDEFPQLLNVFLGSMSLVGPRPHALAHNDEFMTEIAHYANRHHVKPGITGWAQVNGWRGAATEQTQMSNRIDHDLQYIKNWSFGLDLKILFFTFFSPKAFRNAF